MTFGDARLPPRFWSKVEVSGECWLWAGGRNACGYGTSWSGTDIPTLPANQSWLAHRLSYVLLVGSLPEGTELDHLCRVRACVNPTHLEAVSHQENARRGETGAHMKSKTRCPKGHPYSGGNLALSKNPGGSLSRRCRECRNSSRRTAPHYRDRWCAELGCPVKP